MSQDQVPAVARGAQSLLDPLVDLDLRRALAAKIGRVPEQPVELRAILAEVAEHTEDPILRSTCRQALARSRDGESAADEELERWLHQVEVEESVETVFPDVFARYDANPSLCAKILKACVLNPACREKLYYNSFRVGDTAIIQFLISRGALDDDLCRYCVDQALTTPGPGWYVQALCCRADFAGLVEAVWRVFEGATPTSAAYHNSMRDLMVRAFGSENAAVGALQSRLEQLSSPASAVPYVRFLNDLRSWPAIRTVISDILHSGRLLDPTNRGILSNAVNDLFPEMGPQAPRPGLADE
jgi:hypothetical protein